MPQRHLHLHQARAYPVLVKEGKELVAALTRNKWELGDLALEAAPMGEDGAHNGSTAALAEFAEDIGADLDTLQTYRRVAAAWPPTLRKVGASWSVHVELIKEGCDYAADLELLIKKAEVDGHHVVTDDARRLRGRAANRPESPSAPIHDKVTAVQKLLADPKVAQGVAWAPIMKDPLTHARVNKARREVDAERAIKRVSSHKPGALAQLLELMTALVEIGKGEEAFKKSLESLRSLTPSQLAEARQDGDLTESVELAKIAFDALTGYIDGTVIDLADEASAFLADQS